MLALFQIKTVQASVSTKTVVCIFNSFENKFSGQFKKEIKING